ncbi:MAG TPA: SDR family oxidoreductase [Lacisediminihabitans sp.]|uniref:SDR family oxidoreductase n=1 Tax=Lacisediminihabitans sp. TaxID=2787631 RepID=UPI002EDA240A
MGTYAITGAASGMGKESAARLRAGGHTVIGVDLHDAEIVADLSTAEGRAGAAARVLESSEGRLDGAVLAAGLGPAPGREAIISQVNFFGTTELLTAWRPALAAAAAEADAPTSKVVVFASNSATTTPGIPGTLVSAFLGNRPERLRRSLAVFGKNAPAFAYGGSKLALSRWVRRQAVTAQWAGAGIRLNAIAPGAVLTPLLQSQLDGEGHGQIEAFPIPTGGYGRPEQIAEWVTFMLSPAAEFLCGSIIYVDGGTDAYFRGDDWPAAMSFLALPRWLRLSRAWARRAG